MAKDPYGRITGVEHASPEGFGEGMSGKSGSTNLNPGAPQRSKDTGRVGKAFYPNEPTDRETAVAKQAPDQGGEPSKSSSPRVS